MTLHNVASFLLNVERLALSQACNIHKQSQVYSSIDAILLRQNKQGGE